MINWCSNRLLVIGTAEDMKPFLEKAITRNEGEGEEPVWVMSNLYPRPEPLNRTTLPELSDEFINQWEIHVAAACIARGETGVTIPVGIPSANNTPEKVAALMAEYGASNWYDWANMYWGTMWDCNSRDTGIDILNETTLQVAFDSACLPPIKWLEKVAKDYPNINFKLSFIEESEEFCGYVFTTEKDEDGNRKLEEVQGVYTHVDDDNEIDEEFYQTAKNSVEYEKCWFEV